MKALRTWLVAPLLGALLIGVGSMLIQATPASATLPPGWVPGTVYRNIFNYGENTLPAVPGTNHPVFTTAQSMYVPASAGSVYYLPVYSSALGQYCSDYSGGQVWVADGAPTAGLTCPAQSS